MLINGENYELSSTIKIIVDIETGKSSNNIIKSQKKYRKDENNIEIISERPKIRMKIAETLEIRLKQIKTVKDISYMFSGCITLESIEYSKWDTNSIANMASLFNECLLLTSFPDISKWNTSNVRIMNNMFSKCYDLKKLPDISKWNINNVTNISNIFTDCRLLTSLPDISKWNTNNITNMNGIFNCCRSLISLPDISIWNTNNVTDISNIFKFC